MASAGMTIKWIEEDMPFSPEMMMKRITNLRRIEYCLTDKYEMIS